MKVNFKDLKKNLYSLDCQPEETIADLKAKLIDLLKLDPSKFELRLIYSGSILKDINTAEKSGLVDDCTVSYMVKKLVIKKPIGTPAVSAAKAPVAAEAESVTPAEATPVAEPVVAEPVAEPAAAPAEDAELAQSKQIIMELGYNEQQATAALKMSSGNADRACELLMSGLLTDEQIQATNEEVPADEENDDEDLFAAAANAVEGNGSGALNADGNQITLTIDDLMNLRQIASGDVSQLSAFLEKMTNRLPQFKDIIQANPEMFLSMLLESLQNDQSAFTTDFMSGEGSGEGSELASNPAFVESVKKLSEFMETSNIDMQELYRNMGNPNFDPASVPGFEELSTAIASNPEIKNAMMEIMKNPGMMQEMSRMQEQMQGGSVVRPRDPFAELESGLSAEEKQAVDRLCELGFERILVIQIYLACDKNEEVAANMLFTEYAD
ncbi:hypothetical protein ACO0OL_001943 [Hanseniaspora opuntiae]